MLKGSRVTVVVEGYLQTGTVVRVESNNVVVRLLDNSFVVVPKDSVGNSD